MESRREPRNLKQNEKKNENKQRGFAEKILSRPANKQAK